MTVDRCHRRRAHAINSRRTQCLLFFMTFAVALLARKPNHSAIARRHWQWICKRLVVTRDSKQHDSQMIAFVNVFIARFKPEVAFAMGLLNAVFRLCSIPKQFQHVVGAMWRIRCQPQQIYSAQNMFWCDSCLGVNHCIAFASFSNPFGRLALAHAINAGQVRASVGTCHLCCEGFGLLIVV